MAVEIGSLVVRGNFGTAEDSDEKLMQLRQEMAEMRQRLLNDMADMIAEAERRRQDR